MHFLSHIWVSRLNWSAPNVLFSPPTPPRGGSWSVPGSDWICSLWVRHLTSSQKRKISEGKFWSWRVEVVVRVCPRCLSAKHPANNSPFSHLCLSFWYHIQLVTEMLTCDIFFMNNQISERTQVTFDKTNHIDVSARCYVITRAKSRWHVTVQQEQKTLLMFKCHVGKYKRKNVQTVEEILRYKKTREEMP